MGKGGGLLSAFSPGLAVVLWFSLFVSRHWSNLVFEIAACFCLDLSVLRVPFRVLGKGSQGRERGGRRVLVCEAMS